MKKRDSGCINFTLGMHGVSHFSFFSESAFTVKEI